MRLKHFCIFILIIAWDGNANAQQQRFLKDTTNNWHFRAAPYFWFLGIKGTITVPEEIPPPSQLPEVEDNTIDVDLGFKDIRNSLRFALMMNGEYRSARHSVYSNFNSFIIRSRAITPFEFLIRDLTAQLNYFSGDISYGYKIFQRKDLRIDATAGIKYLRAKATIGANILNIWRPEISISRGYIDPAFGMRVIYTPTSRLELSGYGDYGFSVIGITRSFQVLLSANFFITKTFYLSTGYQIWAANFEEKETVFDGQLLGGYFRFGFQF